MAAHAPRSMRSIDPTFCHVACIRLQSHLQTNRPHQLQRVTLFHDSRTKLIVKGNFSVLDMILKVHIESRRYKLLSDMGQSKIVSCHKSKGTSGHQCLDNTFSPNSSIVRIRSMKEFIQQEKERSRSVCEVGQCS